MRSHSAHDRPVIASGAQTLLNVLDGVPSEAVETRANVHLSERTLDDLGRCPRAPGSLAARSHRASGRARARHRWFLDAPEQVLEVLQRSSTRRGKVAGRAAWPCR